MHRHRDETICQQVLFGFEFEIGALKKFSHVFSIGMLHTFVAFEQSKAASLAALKSDEYMLYSNACLPPDPLLKGDRTNWKVAVHSLLRCSDSARYAYSKIFLKEASLLKDPQQRKPTTRFAVR